MSTPGGRGQGVFWWEPAAARGLVPRGYFDAEHNALPVFEAFHPLARPAHRTDGQSPPRVPRLTSEEGRDAVRPLAEHLSEAGDDGDDEGFFGRLRHAFR